MSKKSTNYGLRYLFPSALMVFMAFVFTLTATYAWFTMSISPKVSGILFEVASQDTLQIAVKKWKPTETATTRLKATQHNVLVDVDTSLYYLDGSQKVTITAEYIKTIDDNRYAFTVLIGGNSVVIKVEYLSEESGDFYVYFTDAADQSTAVDTSLYADLVKTPVSASDYILTGHTLQVPTEDDFYLLNNTITEEMLAKVCMNDRLAERITDSLTNATTPIDASGYATSIMGLTEKDGSKFLPNALTAGDRFTANFSAGASATTVYKYEFDLYFLADTNLAVVLNTETSTVTSESGMSSRSAKAWDDLLIDKYTTNQSTKAQYSGFGDGQYVPAGEKIYAESQNAVRLGVTNSAGNPVAIWDPNRTRGWTLNAPDNNIALDFFNNATGSNLYRAPAKAELSSDTLLVNSMQETETGKFRGNIRVTVWLEGYDADCLDSIANQTVSLNLHFAGVTTTP